MPYLNQDQQRAYQREWVKKNREEWLERNGPCVRCTSWNSLQIDHKDRTTKVSHRIWSWSKERRETELAKCQVLCQKCHLEKSREAGDQPPERAHGNRRKYEQNGCRCGLCRAAHTKFQMTWRRKKLLGTVA